MNKRIKELAEQAGFMLWQDEPWNPGDIVDWSARYDDELKKFAELIARDCRDMFVVNSPSWNLLNEKLEHFGVEE